MMETWRSWEKFSAVQWPRWPHTDWCDWLTCGRARHPDSQSGDQLTGNCYSNVGLVFVTAVSLLSPGSPLQQNTTANTKCISVFHSSAAVAVVVEGTALFIFLSSALNATAALWSCWKSVWSCQANREDLLFAWVCSVYLTTNETATLVNLRPGRSELRSACTGLATSTNSCGYERPIYDHTACSDCFWLSENQWRRHGKN